MLRYCTCFGWGIPVLISFDSSVVILSLVFHSSYAVFPLRFQLSCGKSVKYRFIEFFVSDCGSLLYLLSLFFWSGGTFPLVALDKIMLRNLLFF